MRVLIIEDEKPAARHLQRRLAQVDESIEVIAILESIEAAVSWFSENDSPELIFLDIQLADGLSFSLFDHVEIKSHVVFTTAFDEYALKAFEVKSIDYLLKPIEENDLRRALNKFSNLAQRSIPYAELQKLMQHSSSAAAYKTRLLIRTGDEFHYVRIKEIHSIQLRNGLIEIHHGERRSFLTDPNLEEVYNMLDPKLFYRINRQQIVHVDAIKKMHAYLNGRLKLELIYVNQDDFVVARDRVKEFRIWIEG